MHNDALNNTELEERMKTLEAGIKRLEACMDDLLKRLTRVSKTGYEYDLLQDRHLKILDRDQEQAFERIKNLELRLFPGIAPDIDRLHEIIGDHDGKADEPLDRREP
jgi:hypothetical protein